MEAMWSKPVSSERKLWKISSSFPVAITLAHGDALAHVLGIFSDPVLTLSNLFPQFLFLQSRQHSQQDLNLVFAFHLIVVWPWASNLLFLSLGVLMNEEQQYLTYMVGMIRWNIPYKVPSNLAPIKCSVNINISYHDHYQHCYYSQRTFVPGFLFLSCSLQVLWDGRLWRRIITKYYDESLKLIFEYGPRAHFSVISANQRTSDNSLWVIWTTS